MKKVLLKILFIVIIIWSFIFSIAGIVQVFKSPTVSDFFINLIVTLLVGGLPGFIAYVLFKKSKNIREGRENIATKKNNLGAEFHINYVDKDNNQTFRDIKINKFYAVGASTNEYIDCYCFLAHAERTFKVKNITQMIDLKTGEIIKTPADFLMDNYKLEYE